MVNQKLLPTPCPECGGPCEIDEFPDLGRIINPGRCWKCHDDFVEGVDRSWRNASHAERREAWGRICPQSYLKIGWWDAIAPALKGSGEDWVKVFLAGGRKGLGLVGDTGCGKTTVSVHCAKQCFFAGKSIGIVSHAHFSSFVQKGRFGEDKALRRAAEYELDDALGADVLVLDDLGKGDCNEVVDAALYDLIDERAKEGRAIIWSANGSSKWLEAKLGPDRGPALVRRLTEFNPPIKAC